MNENAKLFSQTAASDRLSLKRTSVRSAAITVVSQGASLVLHTISTVVLARLLTPQEFGVVAMVLVIAAFVRRFQDLGLSAATIQSDRLTHDQLSTIFWVNVALGTVMTLAMAALGPALVWFYKTPEVLWIAVASSLNFVITSLGVQHTVLLKRQMRFGVLATRRIVSMAAGVAVSIAAAVGGFGFWALVLGDLTRSTFSTILLWFGSGWRPGSPRRGAGVRGLIRFGANITGFELANYFSRNADNLLIGRVWGAEALGLYSKAYSLLMLPFQNLRDPMNDVAFPVLSQLRQEPARYRQYFSRYLSLMAFATMPASACLLVSAENLVHVVLGPQWTTSAEIFAILAVTGFIQPAASTRGLVLMSTGQDRKYLRIGVCNAVVTASGFLVGIAWGPVGVAVAYGVVNYLVLYPALWYCFAGSPVRVRDFFISIARPATASVIAGVATFFFKQAWGAVGDAAMLALGVLAFVLVYLGVFALLPGGVSELRNYLSFRTYLLPKALSPEAAR